EQDRILKVTGGAFKYLSRVDIESVTSDIHENLVRLGLDVNNQAFVSVSRTILDKGSLTRADFVAAFGGQEKGNAILEGNVFFCDTGTVRFQNRATRNFMADMLAEEEAKRQAEEEAKRGIISRVFKMLPGM